MKQYNMNRIYYAQKYIFNHTWTALLLSMNCNSESQGTYFLNFSQVFISHDEDNGPDDRAIEDDNDKIQTVISEPD